MFKRSHALGFLGASLALLMDSAPAESRSPSGWQLLAGCAERVQELEAEVEALRLQLRGRPGSSSEPILPESEADGLGYDEAPGLSLQNASECAVPFEISKSGVKRYKDRCAHALQPLAPCELPYELDARGVKTFKARCLRSR
jgi:hypothetical protein